MGKGNYETTVFDRARDELFSHIQRCGVLDADDEHRAEWLKDTTDYLRERYPELGRDQLDELAAIGDRYCRPAIRHVEAVEEDAETPEESVEAEVTEAVAIEADAIEAESIDTTSGQEGEEKEVSVA